jgi:hypothetical protein
MRSGAVALLLGSAVGVVAGFAWQSARTGGATAPREVSQVAQPEVAPAPSAAPPAGTATNDAVTATTTSAAAPGAVAAESATVAPEPGSSSALATAPNPPSTSAPVFPFPLPPPPVTDKKELERAEIRCYDVDPEECGRAADAYDAGRIVPRNAAQAERLRKVELTRLVRRCEERSPHACLVLGGRYESGQGVDENDRHARALVAHARELCQHGPKPQWKAECEDGEPK